MRLTGIVEKGWGSENIFVSNDYYAGKLLNFNKDSKFSMHFHSKKHETWYVLSGKFNVEILNTNTAKIDVIELNVGDVHTNVPLMPHRVICLEAGTLLEVSTPDSVEDNYRVLPGDSQNEIRN
jgi:mannose-6-phosphate isomerase-like protein (cupin superfamily)